MRRLPLLSALGPNRSARAPQSQALDCSPFDFCGILEEAVRRVSPQAARKKIELALRYSPGVPRCFDGDRISIRQVILNLLDNAVRFTDAGYVLAEVSACRRHEDVWEVRTAVEDTGAGIPEEKRRLLFDDFERVQAAARFAGRGLGLAIAKKLVQSMGGDIGFESRQGSGSRFWFTLPLKCSPGAAARAGELEGQCPRALVAAPRRVGRKMLTELLSSWDMRVDTVEAAEEVLQAMADAHDSGAPFSLLLLDLPGGNAIASAVAQDGRFERTRVLILGASLTKPAGPLALENAIAGMPATAGPMEPEPAQGRRFRWNVLLVEDNAVSQRVAMAELKSLGCRADVASDGREAVEMVRANVYDMVFMDCVMPEFGGFEATRRIRALEGRRRHTVIVALTASASAEDRRRCRDAGMDDYLLKPVLAEDLDRMLKRFQPAPATRS